MPHGQPVAHVAHAPHGAEERHLDQQARIERGVEGVEMGQHIVGERERQQNPRDQAHEDPGGFPRPFLHFFNRRIKRRGERRTNKVPPNSSKNCNRHSFSISVFQRALALMPASKLKAYRLRVCFVQRCRFSPHAPAAQLRRCSCPVSARGRSGHRANYISHSDSAGTSQLLSRLSGHHPVVFAGIVTCHTAVAPVTVQSE